MPAPTTMREWAIWNWLAMKAPEERPETEVALELGAERRQRDGLRAALREAGGAPEQDRKRSEDCDREMHDRPLACLLWRNA